MTVTTTAAEAVPYVFDVGPPVQFPSGSTPYSYIAAASTDQDSQVVKASAGVLKSLICFCTVATARYLKLYNKATGPTSADTPVLRFMVPANSTTGAGFAFPLPPEGAAFSAGISFRMTTGIADNDTGAVTANDLLLNLVYG